MEIIQFILSILVFFAILTIGFFIRKFLPAYYQEKGKNIATKEDIEEITHKIENVRSQYQKNIEEVKNELEIQSEILNKRRALYENIADSLRVFIGGKKPASIDEKNIFLKSYASAWLWAPDQVIQSLTKFIDLQVKHTAKPESIPQEDMKAAYADCIIEMRKSAGFKETQLEKDNYRFVVF